jgi:hypothetical protein
VDAGEAQQGGPYSGVDISMDGLRQYLAIVAGESANNIDEASAIGSVILNRLVHKGANMQGDFVSKIGGKGQYDAIGGKIYNEVMSFTDRDLLHIVKDPLALQAKYADRIIEKITLHENAFLEIQFRVRGGAGVKMRRKVLICLSGGEIHRALDVISEVSSRVTEVYDKVADSLKLFDEKENYDLAVSIKKKGTVFKATLSESIKIESKYDVSRGESFENTYELDFDTSGCFFYNSMKHLNKRYKVYSVRDNKAVEKFISMEVPCIKLYQSSYLLIGNEWCIDNGNDFLGCL